jgi:hypothetical protein
MSFIDRTTGHNKEDERNVAIRLYIAIFAIALAALIFVLVAGMNPKLNPLRASSPSEVPPVRVIETR